MTSSFASGREQAARHDQMTPFEYGLVIAFVAMALVAAIPGLATSIRHAAATLLHGFA